MPHMQRSRGYSLIELLFVLTFMTTIAGIAAPSMIGALDHYRTAGAVRYVAARLHRTRMSAVGRGVNAAVRFSRVDGAFTYGVYADGNGDGVRSRDIAGGVDSNTESEERLPDKFPGVDFGTLPGLPSVDSSSTPPGTDPIRLGSGDMVAFSPIGTATPGSLYVLGPHHTQYVIRILGETGRIRILRFNAVRRLWEPL